MNRRDSIKFSIAFMLLVSIAIFYIHSVSADLGTYKLNSCVSIRVLANCSNINLTEVSNKNITYKINSPMTNLGGQTFNYSFCNTTLIDTYSFSWNNPCVDCSQGDCGNSFTITPTGYQVDTGKSIIIFASLGMLIIMSLIMFYFGYHINNLTIKIFTIGFSALLLILSLGFILTVLNSSLAEFTTITSIINVVYILSVALLTVGGIGIIVWLIAFVFTMFSKYRGLRD